jgi:hypothetical protein
MIARTGSTKSRLTSAARPRSRRTVRISAEKTRAWRLAGLRAPLVLLGMTAVLGCLESEDVPPQTGFASGHSYPTRASSLLRVTAWNRA